MHRLQFRLAIRPLPLIAVRFFTAAILCSFPVDIALGQTWPDEYQSGPFYFHADFQLRPHYTLLKSATALCDEVPRQLGIDKVDEPIHVFLFERRKTYRGYVKKHFPTAPNRPALFVKQRGPGMVFAYLGRSIAVDLRHEITHAVLHASLPMVPLWLDEGLGEYFEQPAGTREVHHPHRKSIEALVARGRIASIKQLESLSDISAMKPDHYRDAWAWVHFMLHGPPSSRNSLTTFLQDIQARVPPGQLSDRLRRQVPDLKAEYELHFRR